MFFGRAPVNPFSRALSCGFSAELLLAYCALGGRYGNMVLCVLFTCASYRNKVPSTICTASALSSTLPGSSIDGTFKFETLPSFILKTLNPSCCRNTAMATSVINRESGGGNKWSWGVTTTRRLLMGGTGFYQLALLLLNQISKVRTFCLWPVSRMDIWNMSHGFIKHHNHLQCQVSLPVVGISLMIYSRTALLNHLFLSFTAFTLKDSTGTLMHIHKYTHTHRHVHPDKKHYWASGDCGHVQ